MKAALVLFLGAAIAAPFTAVWSPEFRDEAAARGLTGVAPNGGMESKTFIIETTGSGVGFLDYDNDGLLDVFVASGDGAPSRLYHNEGGGRFRDVSKEMGITRTGWAQGVCAGDYDNDGYTDLFVTYWGQNVLYHNEGGKRFRDVTREAGLAAGSRALQHRLRLPRLRSRRPPGSVRLQLSPIQLRIDTQARARTPTAGTWASPSTAARADCRSTATFSTTAMPDGTFTDVSVKSGIAEPDRNYCLSALVADFDGDGWPDIFVPCDQTPSLLYMNQHDGTFSEEALLRGVAFDENGRSMSGMGAAAGDYNHTGRQSIFRTNFSDERETFYCNEGDGQFQERTISAGLGANTRYVSWGCQFFDFDNDGWSDLVLVNGHVFPEIDRKAIDLRFRQRAVLYRNLHDGKFADISTKAGPGITAIHSARGLAVGDIENDGTLEILTNNQGEAPSLLRLTSRAPGNWVLLKLVGTKSNRSAIGARVRLTAGGMTQTAEVRSGGSYLSQSDLRLHFGLGTATGIDRVEIDWPSGAKTDRRNLEVNRIHVLEEP